MPLCQNAQRPATTGGRARLEGGRCPGVSSDEWFWKSFSEACPGPRLARTPLMSPTRATCPGKQRTGTPPPNTLTPKHAAARIAAFALTCDPGKSNRVPLAHRLMSDFLSRRGSFARTFEVSGAGHQTPPQEKGLFPAFAVVAGWPPVSFFSGENNGGGIF